MRQRLFSLLAVGALVGISHGATAADLAVKAPVATIWTGCFIGGHAGGLFGEKDWALTAPNHPVTPVGTHFPTSWLGGFQGGCDYQFLDRLVIGIQGDYAWSDARDSRFDVVDATIDRSRIDSLASVTGRVGLTWERWLGYVRGGAAWTRDEYDRSAFVTGARVGSASETRTGWTGGFGIEYAFTNYVSGFVEANHYDFGTRTVTFLTPAGGLNDNIRIRERPNVAKAGLNFRWGGR